jgi:hypothetical protein
MIAGVTEPPRWQCSSAIGVAGFSVPKPRGFSIFTLTTRFGAAL